MFKKGDREGNSVAGKKEAEKAAKEKAKHEAEAAKKAQIAAARAKKEEEKAAKEKARQEAEAAKKAQVAAARAKKEEEKAAKEKAQQEAEAANKARVAAARAKKEEEKAAKEKAQQEAEAAKKAQIAAAMARKEEEKAAKEKARQEAEAAKKAQVAATMAKKEEEKAAKEKAQQEAEAAKKAQVAAARAIKEEEKAAKEKARQEAEAAKKAQVAAAMARKEEEKAAKEKARQEAEATKKAQVAAARAIKEAEEATKERARQEAEAAKKAQVVAAMARKEEEKAAREKVRQEDEAAKKVQIAAAMARKEEEKAAREKVRQEDEAAKKVQVAAAMAIKEKEEVIAMERRNNFQVNSKVGRKERRPVATMTPLLSGRSLLVLAIGLIVGVALALGYWVVSPSLSSQDGTAGVATGGSASGTEVVIAGDSANGTAIVVAGGMVDSQAKASGLKGIIESVKSLRGSHSGPWEGEVNIQMVSPGSSIMSVDALNKIGAYYAAKANNVRFLEFLSQELDRQVPEYSHTTDELGQMILIQFDAYQETPTIDVKVVTPTVEETAFLCSYIPEVFQGYLIAEEINQRQQEYENTVKELETVKVAILGAQEELRTLRSQGADSDNASIDPARVAINARIMSLEAELSYQADKMSLAIAAGTAIENSDMREQEYQRTVQEARNVRVALSEAEQELGAIAEQMADSDLRNDITYNTLSTKVRALEAELGAQMEILAEYIAAANTGRSYNETLKSISRINSTLIYTRKELAELENTSVDSDLVLDSDYLLARAEVDNLNMELTALIERLTMLARESVGVGEVIRPSDPQAAFERVNVALTEARKELVALDNTSVSDSIATELDYQLAQTKVRNLNAELATLNEKLISMLVSSSNGVEATDYMAVKKPNAPTPVVPMRFRNVMLVGAVVGIGGAWVGMNFRWLSKGAPAVEEETDEE